jgi:hypothetical protein
MDSKVISFLLFRAFRSSVEIAVEVDAEVKTRREKPGRAIAG